MIPMKFERPPELAEIHEEIEQIIQAREWLMPRLKEEAEKLRKLGFGVDDECRIKPGEFKNLFGEENVARDLEWIKGKKTKFEKETPEKIKGEVLEMAKTLTFNNFWFDKRLIALRTSEYDDVANGVDQLIFDAETKTALAAVDATTNWKDKTKEISSGIENGSKVKYGFGFENESLVKKSYYNLPLFIISMKGEELLEVLKDIEKGEISFEGRKVENTVLDELKSQSENFAESASLKLKLSYEKAGEIFERL